METLDNLNGVRLHFFLTYHQEGEKPSEYCSIVFPMAGLEPWVPSDHSTWRDLWPWVFKYQWIAIDACRSQARYLGRNDTLYVFPRPANVAEFTL